MDLTAKVAALRRPAAYPETPDEVEVVETHMSFVFLTARHAYKLKKPVRYDFLDFSTLAAREHDCREEVRLNARLAPNVYLGVVPLAVEADAGVRLEGGGRVVDWLVKMRRLPGRRMLDTCIRSGGLAVEEVRALADRLAEFYRARPTEPIGESEYRQRFRDEIAASCTVLRDPAYGLPGEDVAEIERSLQRFVDHRKEMLDQRVGSGRIVEGHGDLRPEHCCLLDPPVVFDCLEFNRRFRIVDPVDELAFLGMECERLGAPAVDGELLRAYVERTGDRPRPPLVLFYKGARAALRARLSALHLRELEPAAWAPWLARSAEYLAIARRFAQRLDAASASCAGISARG